MSEDASRWTGPLVSAVASLLVPGAGQLLDGQRLRGAVPLAVFLIPVLGELTVFVLLVLSGISMFGTEAYLIFPLVPLGGFFFLDWVWVVVLAVPPLVHLCLHSVAALDAFIQAGARTVGEVPVG